MKFILPVEIETSEEKAAKKFSESLRARIQELATHSDTKTIVRALRKIEMQNGVPRRLVYTDGGCWPNPGGPGGWGWLVHNHDKEHEEYYGGESTSTNNRMELMAMIMALETLPTGVFYRIHTDSKYVKNGYELWLPNWKKRNWRTIEQQPVKNRSLWERLDAAAQIHLGSFEIWWVKGHSGNEGNERADALARRGMQEALAGAKTVLES